MARLVASFPEWISSVEQVGTTRQGRPINLWCVGPGGCSTATKNLPAIMYTALVHAREPATLMCLVHALRKLLGDAAARVGGTHRLLASRKLLFMPIANPDGYSWNERTRPRGGGMKRKNGARTCNPPDTENDGVDLNRNFGFKCATPPHRLTASPPHRLTASPASAFIHRALSLSLSRSLSRSLARCEFF